jgi:GT2 family glycosyltransferase
MVRALRDPDGANLDRIQIIKGWLDKNGKTHEKIYDVAVSGGRQINADGRAKDPVGNTVNLDTAVYTNTIGAALMSAHWTDPDFDPAEHAFYYVRVFEIPTPRWTTFDAVFFGIKRPDNVPPTIQDRAYTSPIWYTPAP